MKKYLMMAVAAIFATNAMALDYIPESGLSWQGIVGFNVSNLKGIDYDGKVGVNFGLKAEYMLPNAKGTYINAGIDWTQKGAKADILAADPTTLLPTKAVNKLQAHYLEIPIHVGWRYNFSEKYGVYADFGPYFAIGVTGKNRIKYDDDAIDDTHTMYFGKHFDGYNTRAIQRFDCGVGFRIGGEYNNQYSINFAADFGITDAYTDKYRKAVKTATGFSLDKLKNRNFTITFGYRF